MNNRFETFTVLITSINRLIRRIKTETMAQYDLKSPHVSCLYYLYMHPGMTAAELCEVCDVVIDNKGCYGDAAINVCGAVTGATSTVIGSMILQAAVCRGIEITQERGEKPEVFQSANTVGGDEANEQYIKHYKAFIRSL